MGYDMDLGVYKKKTLKRLQKEIPECSLSDLYSSCLFAWMYPEEYEIPKDKEARCICSLNIDVFEGFFDKSVENDDTIIIDKDTYSKMLKWLENKLKSTTAYDFIRNPDYEYEVPIWIVAYKNMMKEEIDFDNEVVIFRHDW